MLLVASFYGNQDKLRPYDFTFTLLPFMSYCRIQHSKDFGKAAYELSGVDQKSHKLPKLSYKFKH